MRDSTQANSTPINTKFPWQTLLITLAVYAALTNPWTQTAWTNFTLARTLDWTLIHALSMAGLVIAAALSVFLPLIIASSVEYKLKSNLMRWLVGGPIAIALYVGVFTYGAPITFSRLDMAHSAAMRVAHAEKNTGEAIPARALLEVAFQNETTLLNHRDLVLEIGKAVTRPAELTGILMAADALDDRLPAAQFVIDNNMARPQDIKDIQRGLLEQVRAGDGQAHMALAMLGS